MMDVPSDIANFLRDNPYTFSILNDSDGNVFRAWGFAYSPASYFIDSDGIIRKATIGVFDNSKQIIDILNTL
jgi:hypothetical protein